MSLKWSEDILLLRVVGFSVASLLILVGFLAKFEGFGVPKTFVMSNKPKKVKIKSMLVWYMFPPQILMLEWRIIGSYVLDLHSITILLSVEFLIGVPCWNDHYNGYVGPLLVVWYCWLW